MRLLLIRHAIAVPRGTPDNPDDERPLTKRGRRRFRDAANGLARLVKRPDFVLTSPLPRAKETAQIAAREWGKRVEIIEEPALAGGSVEEISTMLARYPGESTVAVVGHEPDLSEVLARILGTPHEERLTFKKGGAALVELPGSVLEGGALMWYLPPRILREAS
jgi:phosphohistidine phosphatase